MSWGDTENGELVFYIYKLFNNIPVVSQPRLIVPVLVLCNLNLSYFKILGHAFLYQFFPLPYQAQLGSLFSPCPEHPEPTSLVLCHTGFFLILKSFKIYRKVASIIWRTFIYPLTTFTNLFMLLYLCVCIYKHTHFILIITEKNIYFNYLKLCHIIHAFLPLDL